MTTLLSLPPELRNQIYDFLFVEASPYACSINTTPKQSTLADFGKQSPLDKTSTPKPQSLLLTCRQLHLETQPLYFRRTSFTVSGPYASPECFASLSTTLSPPLVSQVRHITLAGRIPHLRAINEDWNGVPFADPRLSLDTLVLVPRRPALHERHYAEIADLSSAHTLAYILSEMLKSLHGVDKVVVKNEDECFNEIVWRVIYTSMINRLLRWGGKLCSCRFRWDDEREHWFEVLPDGRSADNHVWRDAGQEWERLMS